MADSYPQKGLILRVTAIIDEQHPNEAFPDGHFYAFLDHESADALRRAGIGGSPMGRGHSPEAAAADLERRAAMDLASEENPRYRYIEVRRKEEAV